MCPMHTCTRPKHSSICRTCGLLVWLQLFMREAEAQQEQLSILITTGTLCTTIKHAQGPTTQHLAVAAQTVLQLQQ